MSQCAQCGAATSDLRFDHHGRMVCQSCGVAADNADAMRPVGNPSGPYGGGGRGFEYRMMRFAISLALIFVAAGLRMCAHHHY
jgi:hypothetical protein